MLGSTATTFSTTSPTEVDHGFHPCCARIYSLIEFLAHIRRIRKHGVSRRNGVVDSLTECHVYCKAKLVRIQPALGANDGSVYRKNWNDCKSCEQFEPSVITDPVSFIYCFARFFETPSNDCCKTYQFHVGSANSAKDGIVNSKRHCHGGGGVSYGSQPVRIPSDYIERKCRDSTIDYETGDSFNSSFNIVNAYPFFGTYYYASFAERDKKPGHFSRYVDARWRYRPRLLEHKYCRPRHISGYSGKRDAKLSDLRKHTTEHLR
ncbi:hypothetical protein AAVH_25208 [Aphelenchoides avenae]|nr:hypothetical protein AAVH_25208 [Aphelenchus avenae]